MALGLLGVAALLAAAPAAVTAQRSNSWNITGTTGVSAQQLFRGAGNKVSISSFSPVMFILRARAAIIE